MSLSAICYHYTIGPKIPLIEADGLLRPSVVHLLPGERGVLWFSTHPVWEPTATKMVVHHRTGEVYLPTVDELHGLCGLYRYGFDPEKLVAWPELARIARIPGQMAWHLIGEGVRQGADPAQWLGTVEPVPLSALTFEKWDGQSWLPAQKGAARAKSAASARHPASASSLPGQFSPA